MYHSPLCFKGHIHWSIQTGSVAKVEWKLAGCGYKWRTTIFESLLYKMWEDFPSREWKVQKKYAEARNTQVWGLVYPIILWFYKNILCRSASLSSAFACRVSQFACCQPSQQELSACSREAPGSWEASPEEVTEEAFLSPFKTKLHHKENSWKLHFYVQGQISSKEVKVRGRSKTR